MILFLCAILLNAIGCNRFFATEPSAWPEGHEPTSNPIYVPIVDRELVMDQISDELDDYFRIYREERVRLVDHVLTEGWIETHPKIGATLFEPWRRDSTKGFERLHATLQTVRRFAKVRVIPTADIYAIDVKVYKELEDRLAPERATVTAKFEKPFQSIEDDRPNSLADIPNRGWIPMGRDFSLEQQILRNIETRISQMCQPQ